MPPTSLLPLFTLEDLDNGKVVFFLEELYRYLKQRHFRHRWLLEGPASFISDTHVNSLLSCFKFRKRIPRIQDLNCTQFFRDIAKCFNHRISRSTPTSKSKDETVEKKPKSAEKTESPPAAEIDAFFATAENDLHKRFKERYNFDIVNDVPLKGRFGMQKHVGSLLEGFTETQINTLAVNVDFLVA
ncbi:cyclin-dependent kinase inhibitor 7-like protein [Tanacetum coccineum]